MLIFLCIDPLKKTPCVRCLTPRVYSVCIYLNRLDKKPLVKAAAQMWQQVSLQHPPPALPEWDGRTSISQRGRWGFPRCISMDTENTHCQFHSYIFLFTRKLIIVLCCKKDEEIKCQMVPKIFLQANENKSESIYLWFDKVYPQFYTSVSGSPSTNVNASTHKNPTGHFDGDLSKQRVFYQPRSIFLKNVFIRGPPVFEKVACYHVISVGLVYVIVYIYLFILFYLFYLCIHLFYFYFYLFVYIYFYLFCTIQTIKQN